MVTPSNLALLHKGNLSIYILQTHFVSKFIGLLTDSLEVGIFATPSLPPSPPPPPSLSRVKIFRKQ